MNKHYTLIVGHNFSLSNETDHDIQSDYFPGIWGIKTQKRALKFATELIGEGDKITVNSDNPKYHALANWFIKELKLNQSLFKEPEALKESIVTNSKPSNISQLKKFLTVGTKIHVKNYYGSEIKEKDTSVIAVQTNSFIFEKVLGTGIKSWLDIGKASEWTFSNTSAMKYYIDRTGKQLPAYEIIYQ